MELVFEGVALERGVAYQMELADGTLLTARWGGTYELVGEQRCPVMLNVDTGAKRTVCKSSVKWFELLSALQAEGAAILRATGGRA